MAIDGIFLHFIREELSGFAIGAKIDKIFFPSKNELILLLRTRAQTKKLFISVSGNSPRINFTEYSPENPAKPPMICMLFRKQLCGAVITDIKQAGLDRVLFIELNASDDIGERVKRTLAVEITSQYSNCILLDENGVIIDAVKRVDISKSSYREILPRVRYKLPPPQKKLNLLECSADGILQDILACKEKKLSSAILSVLAGVSPLVSKEIAYRAVFSDKTVSLLSENDAARLKRELDFIAEMLACGIPKPCCIRDSSGGFAEFSYMPLTMYRGADSLQTESLSEMLDMFYFERERQQRARSKAEDLFKQLSLLIERTSKKLNIQREELAACGNMEEKRRAGELINANLSVLKKGDGIYRLTDYYNNCEIISVPVQPNLTPSQNAQRLYKEYRKAKNAEKFLTEQIEKSSRDLDYLLSVKDELSRADTESELGEIRAEIAEAGFLKSKAAAGNKKSRPLPPLEFLSPGGFKVLVGRNNTQNDVLSLKKAAKSDIWFHVKNAPGAHVILFADGREPAVQDMEFAAQTAAYFSSVRASGYAEVDYTAARNLKKPPAAKPGFVIYHIYNTVYVSAVNPADKNKER